MISRNLSRLLYTPANKLQFKDGRCLVMKESNIEPFMTTNSLATIAAPLQIFWALEFNPKNALTTVILSCLPFLMINILLSPFFSRTINALYLHKDGKQVSLKLCFNPKKLYTFNISELKFIKIDAPQKSLLGTVDLPTEETLFFIKSSKIYYEDVFYKIMEGEEINVDDSENQENNDDQDSESDDKE
ncbi:hypothetical protein SteCoe_19161 [Stentor coeruleus]|uniref:Uncharacterized protein n=1 Tax=Stentor coeruleus TaxID=5963 RepID=A0A1R2BUX7_9CILI|nr:hypothetical protein SteCoe_19161 [Stentor coeruleus]